MHEKRFEVTWLDDASYREDVSVYLSKGSVLVRHDPDGLVAGMSCELAVFHPFFEDGVLVRGMAVHFGDEGFVVALEDRAPLVAWMTDVDRALDQLGDNIETLTPHLAVESTDPNALPALGVQPAPAAASLSNMSDPNAAQSDELNGAPVFVDDASHTPTHEPVPEPLGAVEDEGAAFANDDPDYDDEEDDEDEDYGEDEDEDYDDEEDKGGRKRGKNLHVAERLRDMTPVQRRKLALSGNKTERTALERMYGKEMWDTLLSNRKISVSEVANIARKGALPIPLVEQIVSNPSWLRSSLVRRALLTNPRLKGRLITKVLKSTPLSDLKLIPKTGAYTNAVRSEANKILKTKKR